jgi:excisionase family DNA binding protein
MTNPNAPTPLLTVRQAGVILGLSARSVWRIIRQGQLRTVCVGERSRRIHPADLARYVEERRSLLAAEA